MPYVFGGHIRKFGIPEEIAQIARSYLPAEMRKVIYETSSAGNNRLQPSVRLTGFTKRSGD